MTGALMRSEPGYYADRGVPALLELMHIEGIDLDGALASLVGGASVSGGLDRFAIGHRTAEACRGALRRLGWAPAREDVGGSTSRTVRVAFGDPWVQITNPALGTRRL
jgi:chemotaxis receptor (MCP) glutamine deamidase CheD